MFRGTLNSKIDPTHFGVGSVVVGSHKEYWLVVGSNKVVRLLNLSTYQLSKDGSTVEDINFISSDEAREICNLTEEHFAFSDYTLDAEGLKSVEFKFKY